MNTRLASLITLAIAAIILPSLALAVHPKEWVHQAEADFQESTAEQVIVTNFGRLQLARETKELATLENEDSVIYDILQMPDGTIYAATGPVGKLLKLDQAEFKEQLSLEGEQIFALAHQGPSLWLAVSGAESRIDLFDGEKVTRSIALPDVRYVWAILIVDNHAWLATGTDGKVLRIDLTADEPEVAVVLDTEQKNILSMTADPASGDIYVGTDGQGLVYRLSKNPANGNHEPFIIYDAKEPEIGALLVGPDGAVYIGTSDAEGAKTGRMEAPAKETNGTPEVEVPEEIDAPAEPAPAEEAPAPEEADPADAEPAPADPQPANARPTAEQYDQLRNAIRERLAEARERGGLTVSGSSGPSVGQQAGTASGGKSATKSGNAVYRIDREGFVREVFRESVMILRLAMVDGHLIVATGNEGQIYQVNLAAEEVALLAKLDAAQLPALRQLADGRFLIGTANPGRLIELGSGFAAEGSITSQPLDATQVSLWGRLRLTSIIPEGASLRVQTRSGNIEDPEKGPWSPWSAPRRLTPSGPLHPASAPVDAPPARFLQYRLLLAGTPQVSPEIGSISLKYLTPNLRPVVKAIKTEYDKPRADATEPTPQTTMKISWEAEDPNGDKLAYTLQTRRIDSDEPFISVIEDHDKNNFEWDTRRTADGLYELRIEASDAPDNVPGQALTAARRSGVVVVDNTPPAVENFQIRPAGPGQVEVTAVVVDALSEIADVRYSVAGQEGWHLILPTDLIYDSTRETISFTISDLSPGRHTVTIRATDTSSNSRFTSGNVDVAR